MSTKGFLIDATIRRQVFLERYSNGRIAKLNPILEAMRISVNGLVQDADRGTRGNFINAMERLDRELAARFDEISDFIIESVLGVAESEIDFVSQMLREALEVIPITPTFAAVEAAIYAQALATLDPDEVLTLNEALEQFSNNKRRELRQIIDAGLSQGQTVTQITDRVNEIVENRQTHQARALVRTAINHATSMVSKAMYSENPGIVNGYQWVATLDSRTTLICAGRDGRVYSASSNIYPPAHWNCRSRTIPLIGEEFDKANLKGDRPQKGDKIGTVSANTDFDSWLRRQSADFQDEYFSQFTNGDELAKLFRRGKMPIQKFRNELGKQYSLDELRQLDPIAFNRANIEAPGGG